MTAPRRCYWNSAAVGGSSRRPTGSASWAGSTRSCTTPTAPAAHPPTAASSALIPPYRLYHISRGQRTHYAANRAVSRDQPQATHVVGGGSVSDSANRFMYHPSHPVPGSSGGVVLASYSWADDALRWDSLDDEARYPHALCGLQQVYGQRVEVFYTGAGRTQSWLRDPYAYGEASVLLPGQHTELLPSIPVPEGPMHFAGDHTLPQAGLDRGRPGIGGPRRTGGPHLVS